MCKMNANEVDHDESEEVTDKEDDFDRVRQKDKTKSVVWVHFHVIDGKNVCTVSNQ